MADCLEETSSIGDQESPLSSSNHVGLTFANANIETMEDLSVITISSTTSTSSNLEVGLIEDCNSAEEEVIYVSDNPPIQVIDLTCSPMRTDGPRILNQNVLECPVCFEDLYDRQTSVTPCGHYFCTDCIKACLAINNSCPTCRKICLARQLYPLYLFGS